MRKELNALYGTDGKHLTGEQIIKAQYQQEPIDATCNGCVYEHCTDMAIALERCVHCKRAYSKREDHDFHDDLYLDKKELAKRKKE